MQAFASHHHHAGATTSSITPRVSFLSHAVGRVITDQHAIFIRGRIIILQSSIALCPFVLDWLRDKLPGGCSGPWLPTAATCQRQGKRKRTLGREEIADTQASKDAMHFSYRFPNWGTCVRNTQPFTCCRCYCCRSDLQGFEIQSLFFHKQTRPWFTSLWSAQVKTELNICGNVLFWCKNFACAR